MNPHLPIFAGLLLLAMDVSATVANDDLGRQIELPQAAQRIVSLAPHATELVIAAGLERALVGIAGGGEPPARLNELPRIGAAGALDREALMALQPDLVIGWYSGNRSSDLAWIDRSGTALYLSEPSSLQHIAESIRALGTLGGHEHIAARNAAEFEQSIKTDCADLPLREIYIQVWDRPSMTIGGKHWINAALSAAGYRNRFANEPRGAFAVADEAAFASRQLPRVSLIRTFDNSPRDRLAKLLSMPGPKIGEAIKILCQRRKQNSMLPQPTRDAN